MKIKSYITLFSFLLICCKTDETNFWGQYSQVNFKVRNETKNTITDAKIIFKNSSLPQFDDIIVNLKPFQEIKFSYNLKKLSTLEEGSAYMKLANKSNNDYLFFFEAMGSYFNEIDVQVNDEIVTVKTERIEK